MASFRTAIEHFLGLLFVVISVFCAKYTIYKDLFPSARPVKYGDKIFFIQTFFNTNWYRAEQFCRYHGMQLASISSEEELELLGEELNAIAKDSEFDYYPRYWVSGNDLAQSGHYVWSANGESLLFRNWGTDSSVKPSKELGPSNCVTLVKSSGKHYKWYVMPCKEKYYFVCQVQNRVKEIFYNL